jgi:hypothetical protein
LVERSTSFAEVYEYSDSFAGGGDVGGGGLGLNGGGGGLGLKGVLGTG